MAIKWISVFTVPPTAEGMEGVKFEDGGDAAIMYFPLDDPQEIGGDGDFFPRLQSWNEDPDIPEEQKHRLFRQFMGRKVRVTIETIDDEPETTQGDES